MRKVVRVLVGGATLSVGLLAGLPAASGGGSVFDFNRNYFVPGDLAVARESFSANVRSQARIADGPWYAYLLPQDRWIHPPNIPPASIPLGEVRIVHTEEMGHMAVASLSFVVPDLEPGGYSVGLCNDPCTDTIVGDLIGGWFTVAGSREEIELMRERDRLERQLSSMTSRLRHQLRQTELRLEAEVFQQEARANALSHHVDELQTILASSQDRGTPWTPIAITGWGLAAVAATAAVLIARRRKPAAVLARFAPPRTAPAERPHPVPDEASR